MKRDENLCHESPGLGFVESKSGKEVDKGVGKQEVSKFAFMFAMSVLGVLGSPKNVEATPPGVQIQSLDDVKVTTFPVANYSQFPVVKPDGSFEFLGQSDSKKYVTDKVYFRTNAFIDVGTGQIITVGNIPQGAFPARPLSLPNNRALIDFNVNGNIRTYFINFNSPTPTAQPYGARLGSEGLPIYLCHESDDVVIFMVKRGPSDPVTFNKYIISLNLLQNSISESAVPQHIRDLVPIVWQIPRGFTSVTKFGGHYAGVVGDQIVYTENPEIEQPATVSPEIMAGEQRLNLENARVEFSVGNMPMGATGGFGLANLEKSGLVPNQNGEVRYELTGADKQAMIAAGNGEWAGNMTITVLDGAGNVLKTEVVNAEVDFIAPDALDIAVDGLNNRGEIEVEKGVQDLLVEVRFTAGSIGMGDVSEVSVVSFGSSDFSGVDLQDEDAVRTRVLSLIGVVQATVLQESSFVGGVASETFTFRKGGNVVAALTTDSAGNTGVSFQLVNVVEKQSVDPVDMGGGSDMGTAPDMDSADMGGGSDMGTTPDMDSADMGGGSDMGGKADMPNGENPVQPKPDPVNPNPSNPDTGAEDEGGCAVAGVEGGKQTDPAGIVLGVGVLVGGVMARRRKRKIPKSGK